MLTLRIPISTVSAPVSTSKTVTTTTSTALCISETAAFCAARASSGAILFFQLLSGEKAHCKIAGGGDFAAHRSSLACVMTGITLVHRFSAHQTQKVYPWYDLFGFRSLSYALRDGPARRISPAECAPTISGLPVSDNPRIVAWVDFDVAPVRQGVARFREHLKSQHFEGPATR